LRRWRRGWGNGIIEEGVVIDLLKKIDRTIVGELGYLNPILLLDELIATINNGGGVRIGWYADAAADGVRVLRAHGVKTWGYRMAYDPDRRWCKVRRRQARWAVALLMGAGYGICDGPVDVAPVRPARTWGAPARAQGFAGLLGNLFMGGARRQRRGSRGR
jgi:hypothetical protein